MPQPVQQNPAHGRTTSLPAAMPRPQGRAELAAGGLAQQARAVQRHADWSLAQWSSATAAGAVKAAIVASAIRGLIPHRLATRVVARWLRSA